MLDRVVHYLRSHNVSFRLSSRPSQEPLPALAYQPPPGGLLVETHVLLVGGKPAIACAPRGSQLSLPDLNTELGVVVVEGTPEDLPPPYTGASGPTPPLGRAMGLTTIVDESLLTASSIVFAAFAATDIVEIPYDDFARLEQPRVAAFAIGGELAESSEELSPERKVA